MATITIDPYHTHEESSKGYGDNYAIKTDQDVILKMDCNYNDELPPPTGLTPV